MKYIKTFEDLKNEPQVGDYVLIKTVAADGNIKNFINNTIGIIDYIQPDFTNLFDKKCDGNIGVRYKNIPKSLQLWFGKGSNVRQFLKKQIVAIGKTEEEVKQKVQSNKFNI